MDNDIGLWLLRLAPLIVVGVLLLVVGIVLIITTVKRKVTRKLKMFQLLAGASALGIPVFAVLHNVAYMLGIMWFGEGVWGNVMSLHSSFWHFLFAPQAYWWVESGL